MNDPKISWTSRLASKVTRYPTQTALGLFVACFLSALPFSPGLWSNYISQPIRKFDMDIYLTLGRDGYHLPSSPAFYPLWPQLLSLFGGLGDTAFTHAANSLSLICFAATLPLLWRLLNQLTDSQTATWCTILFAVNPNSIFHALAYPESLVSLLSVWFLLSSTHYLASGGLGHLVAVMASAALMSSARPVFLQLAAAGVAATTLVPWIHGRSPTSAKKPWIWCMASVSSCVAGYLPFGIFCAKRFGNFWQPFAAQSYWDRSFGLHWSLVIAPKSVGGSDNILTWDLLAFYGPIVLIMILIQQIRAMTLVRPSVEVMQNNLAESRRLIGFFCLAFAAAHSAIAFLTYPIFMSLARHVFATPFFFVGAAVVAANITSQKLRDRLILATITLSILYLIHFWTRFGRAAWLG